MPALRLRMVSEPLAVAGRLSGQPVVLIVAPNAPKSVLDATVKGLADAGATLTGVIDLRPSFVDPAQVANLGELATSLGATAPSQNVAGAGVGAARERPCRAAHDLVGAAGTLDATSTEILAGLAQGGFIAMRRRRRNTPGWRSSSRLRPPPRRPARLLPRQRPATRSSTSSPHSRRPEAPPS